MEGEGGGHLPAHNREYKEKAYWDSRFEKEADFDWFKPYDHFQHIIREHVKPTDRILMVGCGNSSLSRSMYDDGYPHITNLDFSAVVIAKMAARHSDCKTMTWVEMDMTDMKFADNSFDVVIEKGTIDAVMVDVEDQWAPQQSVLDLVHRTLENISRVLTPSGVFLSITFAQPHFRLPLYQQPRYNWAATYVTFGDTFHYYVYSMHKGSTNTDPRFAVRPRAPPPITVELSDSDTDEGFLFRKVTVEAED
eukprot:comp46423_c0_seq1/m.47574 comp46423_c0_seq1/g.47574  ORF comp46423_c0_seq1/g.47574 comp46423_c0_seq1/m.47574 type:complete len:250 (-) comp46423_c0_seq1:143-892(-)